MIPVADKYLHFLILRIFLNFKTDFTQRQYNAFVAQSFAHPLCKINFTIYKGEFMNILQYLKTYKKRQNLDLLNNSLASYGLRPTEWQLIKEDGTGYKIANKMEPSFFFRGKTKYENGRKKWSSIYLAGL